MNLYSMFLQRMICILLSEKVVKLASGKKQAEGKKSKKQRNFLEWVLDVSGLSGDSDDDVWEEEWEEEEEYQSHKSQDTKKKQKEQDEAGKKKSRFKVYKGENETWQQEDL